MISHIEQAAATLEAAPAQHNGAERSLPGKPGFAWQLQGRIITLDHGARLVQQERFSSLMALNSFAVIAFDPASRLHGREELQELEEFQLVPHAMLGSGEEGTLLACLDAAMSATLEPAPPPAHDRAAVRGSQVLTRLPLPCLRLDDIQGLSSIDWLLLDDRHDNRAILQHGRQALRDTLLVQVSTPFRASHHGQTDMATLQAMLAEHGLRFYCMVQAQHRSQFPGDLSLEVRQSSELLGADLLFIPDEQRMAQLSAEQRHKLAFLVATVYELHDLAYAILAHDDQAQARRYLIDQKWLWCADETEQHFIMSEEYSPDIWEAVTQ